MSPALSTALNEPMDKIARGCEILCMSGFKTPKNIKTFHQLLGKLPGPDADAFGAAEAREPQLTKPPGSLGRLEVIAHWLAAWQGQHPPEVENIAVRVFAGNHGVVAKGVSAYPPEVTAQMVANFEAGGAAVNQLCKAVGADLQVIAIDLDSPTADFTESPAMSEADFMAAVRRGMEAVPESADLLCVGEMGIGNTTSAAALAMGLYGGDAKDWTGPGTGVAGDAFSMKMDAVGDAVRQHAVHLADGLQALRHLGGRELAAMAGAIVAARMHRVPVLLDGYVVGAAAASLAAANPSALDHCMAAHVSAEPGHVRLLDLLGMPPLLDMNMRLGEASGAVLAVSLLKSAAACHSGMATFDEAGVSDKDAATH